MSDKSSEPVKAEKPTKATKAKAGKAKKPAKKAAKSAKATAVAKRPRGRQPGTLRTSVAEVERRRVEAEEMLVAGLAIRTIARKMADKYGVSERAGRSYAQQAVERLIDADDGTDQIRRKAIWRRRLERLYAKASADGQYTAAVAAARQCMLLDGVIDAAGNLTIVVAPGADLAGAQAIDGELVALFTRLAAGDAPPAAGQPVIDIEAHGANGRDLSDDTSEEG